MDQDWFESVSWWKNVSVEDLSTYFTKILPEYHTPWAKNTRSWGTDDGNRIELIVEDGKAVDVSIRIDLRDIDLNLLYSLARFAASRDFLFYVLESSRFVEPNLESLLEEIKKSRKILFLESPEKFFDETKYLDKINNENRKLFDKTNQKKDDELDL